MSTVTHDRQTHPTIQRLLESISSRRRNPLPAHSAPRGSGAAQGSGIGELMLWGGAAFILSYVVLAAVAGMVAGGG